MARITVKSLQAKIASMADDQRRLERIAKLYFDKFERLSEELVELRGGEPTMAELRALVDKVTAVPLLDGQLPVYLL